MPSGPADLVCLAGLVDLAGLVGLADLVGFGKYSELPLAVAVGG